MTPSDTLYELLHREWEYWMKEFPLWASSLGDRRYNDEWGDHSPEAFERWQTHNQVVIAKLDTIDRGKLTKSAELDYDLFRKHIETAVEEHEFEWHLIPLTHLGGIQTSYDLSDSLPFETPKDYEDWLARLSSFDVYMEQTVALMEAGLRRGVLLPKVVMRRVPDQIAKLVSQDGEANPFYKPFRRFADSISEASRLEFQTAGLNAITSKVIPSFLRLKRYFDNTYLPACYEQVGIRQIPQGRDAYCFFVRKYTTTELSPDEVHELGVQEIRRIRAEMEAIKKTVGFTGSLDEFILFLRTDSQFHFTDSAELLMAYRDLCKRIDPLLVRVFRKCPRTPYGVEPIPETKAPDVTTAYYRPPAEDGSRAGTYFVNLYKPETRLKHEMMALSLHEAVPGHHFQIATAMEMKGVPAFRRHMRYTSFVEGWALYAESLGYEMGLYDDPYDRFGQLTYDIFRAARLVVDTGIHWKGWDRQRAIDYLMTHAAKSEHDIVNEIDRYISWPGQSLAYKIGELKIKELLRRAENELGMHFDLKAFHEKILDLGAVPLDILEYQIAEWSKRESSSAVST